MTIVTMSVRDELWTRFKEETFKAGKKKGTLKTAFEAAIEQFLDEKVRQDSVKRQLSWSNVKFGTGGLTIKSREEIYDGLD